MIARLARVVILCLALGACGGSSAPPPRQEIQHTLDSMQSAMARGDYAGACQWFSQREQATIVSAAKRTGLSVSDCRGAFAALIKTAGVSKAQLAQAFGGGRALKIHSVAVHGNQATVTYTAKSNGKSFTETDSLVRQNGAWRADRTISRHDTG